MAKNKTPLEGPTETSGATGGDHKDHWRVLKEVPIYTKIVVPMVALAIVPATIVGALLILQMQGLLEWPVPRVIILLSTVVGLTVAVAVSVANALARPVAVLHRTIRRIAAGDVSERIRVRTGDEIEGFASDFNTMLDRLCQTQSWNIELEAEVAQKTNRLRGLQAGLARVDKLTSIGQMTAGVLHEIGNPLAALKAKIQVAEEDGTRCALMPEILAEVDRLAAFLRSFSRLAKLPEPRFESVDTVEIVQSVEALVTQELQRRGVFLRVDSALRIPMVRGDADQLRQLLMNLILNAAEASPRSNEVRIKIDHRRPAWGIRLQVSDDGVGIAAENIHRIWEPFFTTKADGTGLGLAICRQIIEAHGGIITLRSEERVGTTVTVILPPAESELVSGNSPDAAGGVFATMAVEENFHRAQPEEMYKLMIRRGPSSGRSTRRARSDRGARSARGRASDV